VGLEQAGCPLQKRNSGESGPFPFCSSVRLMSKHQVPRGGFHDGFFSSELGTSSAAINSPMFASRAASRPTERVVYKRKYKPAALAVSKYVTRPLMETANILLVYVSVRLPL